MRLSVVAAVVASLLAGCVRHVERRELPAEIAALDAEAERARTAASRPPVAVPVHKRWRFAGTRGDEYVLVYVGSDGKRRRLAVPRSEFVLPDLAYTDDDRRWIPVKPVPSTRWDGSTDIDFARLTPSEIDAARDPLLGKDAVRKGGL